MSDPDYLLFREWINAVWFSLSLCATLVFANYLGRAAIERSPGWHRTDGVRAAVALFLYFLGETMVRGWVWFMLTTRDNQWIWSAKELQRDYFVAFFAAGISVLGALYCIRVFSRSKWGLIWSALTVTAFFGLGWLI